MNLSKRALVVIIPVLLVSYCVAALSVYSLLENTTKRLEQSRLDLAATELAASFNQYSTFGENYLLTLVGKPAFRRMIGEHENVYHHVALGSSIEATIRSFKQHQSNKLSFAVVEMKPKEKELYYFELSDDPFAVMSEAQKQTYRDMFSAKSPSGWSLIEDKHGKAEIVISGIIDRTTYRRPIRTLLNDGIAVQFSIEPSNYLVLKQKIEDNYQAIVTTGGAAPKKIAGLHASQRLGKDLAVHIAVPPSYLDGRLAATRVLLFIISLLFFIFSSLLLYRLINRYITAPIKALEVELGSVQTDNKSNINLRHSGQGEVGRLESTFHKIYGELSRSYLKTKELAEHDPLTKLHNLTYVSELVQERLIEARKNDGNIALIYIDLDNFKLVNDKYGHEVGDALLKAFAARLNNVIRQVDLVCGINPADTTLGRIAGDEFAVIISHFEDKDVPSRIAQRVLSIFDKGFVFEQGTFPVSASIGISLYPEDGHTLSQLLSNADHAMYQAKNSGKNKISFYSKELALKLRRRMDIERELSVIDFDDEFHLVYMPLVCSKSNQIDGFEVLLRWTSAKLGFVGPDEFIPIAEANGMFVNIDAWVSEAAIKSYKVLKQRLGRDFRLSINLSSAQLNMNLVAVGLNSLAEQYQVPTQNIQLEMTETLNVEYSKQADALLNVLCDSGFKIAIDDFGTGYTALLQLVEYPAHMIKFDKEFVDKAMHPQNRSMLEPLVSLCQSQGLEVTVEGVETEEGVNYLRSIGCDYLQGYYFGLPAKIDDLDLVSPGKHYKTAKAGLAQPQ